MHGGVRRLTEVGSVEVLVVHVFAEPLAESQGYHSFKIFQTRIHRGRRDRDQREQLDAAP